MIKQIFENRFHDLLVRRAFIFSIATLFNINLVAYSQEKSPADPSYHPSYHTKNWYNNWPEWRGPFMDGTVPDSGYPLSWSPQKNVLWKTAIPGYGHSSPIVWEDRIFLTSCPATPSQKPKSARTVSNEKLDRFLFCIDRQSGKIIWKKLVVQAPLEPIHNLNSFASSTPATNGKYVYVTFLDNPYVRIACYDFAGNQIWLKTPGKFFSMHGFCSPPILYKDMVIVNADQDAKGTNRAYVVALDQKTGEERYRIDRPNRIRSYTPPLIVRAADKDQMVFTGAKSVASYDANNGDPIWHIQGPTEQFVASMIFHKNLFFLTAGFPTYHVMAIKPGGKGDVTKTHVIWHEVRGAGYVPSPVACQGNIFLVHDNGLATCRDATTGKLIKDDRLGQHHTASPICADQRIYYLDDKGMMWVVNASSKDGELLEVLSKNPLEEECYASPAFCNHQIFIRSVSHLWCIQDNNPEKKTSMRR